MSVPHRGHSFHSHLLRQRKKLILVYMRLKEQGSPRDMASACPLYLSALSIPPFLSSPIYWRFSHTSHDHQKTIVQTYHHHD